jgi:ADP-ribosylglycohydrolase
MGSSTLKALRDLAAGGHWALAGAMGERSAGNGAAMRIAPLAFVATPSTDAGRTRIRDIARITHRNDAAYVGALAVIVAIQIAFRSGLQHLPGLVADSLPDSLVRDRLRELISLSDEPTSIEIAARFGSSAYVVESVPLAIYAAQRAERDGLERMLYGVIEAGGDTDSNASIAGQIAGACLGAGQVPSELLEKIPEVSSIRDVAKRFANHLYPPTS